MRKVLSLDGLVQIDNVEKLIYAAQNSGFNFIDVPPALIREAIVRLNPRGLQRILAQTNVSIASFPSSCNWNGGEEEFDRSFEQLKKDIEFYSYLGCSLCHNFIMPSCDESPDNWFSKLIERIAKVGKELAKSHMNLALEYIGPYHMRNVKQYPFIHHAKDVLDLINQIEDEDNIGVLLDTFHWYSSGETLSSLQEIPGNKIFHVHINDAANIKREELRDNDRLFPGEGIIDLEGFFNVLRSKKYNGFVALEVLQPKTFPESNISQLSSKAYSLVNKYLD